MATKGETKKRHWVDVASDHGLSQEEVLECELAFPVGKWTAAGLAL